MSRSRAVTALLLSLAAFAGAKEPVRTETVIRKNPEQHLFVAHVDLSDPRVSVVVAPAAPDPDGPGPWETSLRPTSAIARDLKLDLAVNTVFFSHQTPDNNPKKYATGEPAAALNLVVIDGKPATPNVSGALLAFDKTNRVSVETITPNNLPQNVWQGAAGSKQIVAGGKSTNTTDNARHPRTAAGVTADGTLVLLVADGRRPGWAVGLTLGELADEMIALGCVDAINFDGGGSSTMVRRDGDDKYKVLNTPSDGSTFVLPLSIERPVPYVLGFRVKRD